MRNYSYKEKISFVRVSFIYTIFAKNILSLESIIPHKLAEQWNAKILTVHYKKFSNQNN